ncbi:hypothetical protein BD324DRAFT_453282 [Kockovaella imperatae]|uniref:Uncharacterized protein n=1 Tax=Kockovaella imperatae TaxID=4999 RepID=A0A1Y1UEV5_9TREE|nr:hypothetical protein BD324DRAFT_453282 [Kockovaella imperatae]ORX36573.1 hypothetical protein BD324DRAFT_453282 [Kockovaella imperatae]
MRHSNMHPNPSPLFAHHEPRHSQTSPCLLIYRDRVSHDDDPADHHHPYACPCPCSCPHDLDYAAYPSDPLFACRPCGPSHFVACHPSLAYHHGISQTCIDHHDLSDHKTLTWICLYLCTGRLVSVNPDPYVVPLVSLLVRHARVLSVLSVD